jgi:hypothetical protein
VSHVHESRGSCDLGYGSSVTHLSDSAEQRLAEPLILAALTKTLGIALAPETLRLPGGSRVDIDGVAQDHSVLVEVFAHQGPMKTGQRHKVARDALKLVTTAKSLVPTNPRLIIAFGDKQAAATATGKSWLAEALVTWSVEVFIAELQDSVKDGLRAAQARQVMVNPAAGREQGDDVSRVQEHLRTLGDPAEWTASVTYDSLALAIIDSVWSIGVRYGGVLNVLERYRDLRRAQGCDPEYDTPADLVRCIQSLGGPDAFANAVNNRQRTSSRSGILKSEAVFRQARMLAEEGITSPKDLAEADATLRLRLRRRWTEEVAGQASGLSWDYLLMLCGLPGVKADRMVRRFVADALGCEEKAVSAARAHALVTEAAERSGLGASRLDYAIWRYQSGQ